MKTETTDRYLTLRCKAFSNEGVRTNSIMVDADYVSGTDVIHGLIRVWDSVAGHYTACHSLSESAKKKIRRTLQP